MPEDIKLQIAEDGKGLSTHDYTATDKAKVDAIPENPEYTDTVYTHPDSHPASMITQDATHRFVTDTWMEQKDNHTHSSVQTKEGVALKFSRLTQAEYDALVIKDADTLYLIVG